MEEGFAVHLFSFERGNFGKKECWPPASEGAPPAAPASPSCPRVASPAPGRPIFVLEFPRTNPFHAASPSLTMPIEKRSRWPACGACVLLSLVAQQVPPALLFYAAPQVPDALVLITVIELGRGPFLRLYRTKALPPSHAAGSLAAGILTVPACRCCPTLGELPPGRWRAQLARSCSGISAKLNRKKNGPGKKRRAGQCGALSLRLDGSAARSANHDRRTFAGTLPIQGNLTF